MTRSRRRKGGHGGGGGGGGGHGGGDSRWLVTYADLLTLLMVLFLVLWVISTIDLKKFEQFKSGLGDFGNKAASAAAPVNTSASPSGDQESTTSTIAQDTVTTAASDPGTGNSTATAPLTKGELAAMVGQLNLAIDQSGLNGVVDVHVEERGLVVSISTDNVLFESGQGSLTPAGVSILGSVAPQIAALSNDVIIEGYTDKRPLRRQGYDNWDLSVDRAVSVLKVLRDDFGFPATRLAATGYGDTKAAAVGDDDASLARDRRVEIVIVAGSDASPTSSLPVADPATATATSAASPADPGVDTTLAPSLTVAGSH